MALNMESRITIAPFLNFKKLFKILFYRKLDDITLAVPWTKKEQYPFWLSRSAWSFKLIVLTYATTNKISNFNKINIWIPEYFCNSSLELIRELGTNLIFYKITDIGEPDIEWCNKISQVNKPNIFIAVHYFGKPIDLSFVNKFCKSHECWLIEDAAHALQKSNNIGNNGDFIIFSPHKLIAIPNGALLIFNKSGVSSLKDDSIFLKKLRFEYLNLLKHKTRKNYSKSIYFWIFKRLLQDLGFRTKYTYNPIWPEILNYDNSFTHPRMNFISKKLLAYEVLFLNLYASQRKSNLNLLKEYLSKDILLRDLIHLPILENHDPYILSIKVNQNGIEYVNKYLYNKKLPVLTWPDLPPEILANEILYSTSIHLRKSILHIPIHQNITAEEIKECFKN